MNPNIKAWADKTRQKLNLVRYQHFIPEAAGASLDEMLFASFGQRRLPGETDFHFLGVPVFKCEGA